MIKALGLLNLLCKKPANSVMCAKIAFLLILFFSLSVSRHCATFSNMTLRKKIHWNLLIEITSPSTAVAVLCHDLKHVYWFAKIISLLWNMTLQNITKVLTSHCNVSIMRLFRVLLFCFKFWTKPSCHDVNHDH